jgi:SAM-dependent methyltransferase
MPPIKKTKPLACPICGYGASWPMPYRRDTSFDAWRVKAGDTAPYDWRLCRRCGNAYPSFQPGIEVLRHIWEENRVIPSSDMRTPEEVWAARHAAARKCAERSFALFAARSARSPGRFLDIGCGPGDTVRHFADHGWDAEGIDADPNMAPVHRRLGIRSQIGQFETMQTAGGYDIIHIAHAIYFITEPMRFLGAVRERLAPGGVFGIVLADFMATFDPGLPSYPHSFFPTAASMRYALALAGFETVSSRVWAGSVYLAARPAQVPLPTVHLALIRLGYFTKPARYALLGRPYLALRRAAKSVLRRG